MAYDQRLPDRIREAVRAEPLLVEQRMFGGFAFLTERAALRDRLLDRVDIDGAGKSPV